MSHESEMVGKLYEENLEKLGKVTRALGWKSKEEQLLRFEKLTSGIDFSAGPISVNDYGAGFGDLHSFLERSCGADILEYNAYEVNEKVMEACRDNLEDVSGCNFIVSDQLMTQADYSIVSGTFNVRLDTSESDWRHGVLQTLNQLDKFSTRGFAFNLLSSYVDWKQDNLFYASPEEFLSYCLTNFSRKVELHHGFPPYEWTICVTK